MNDSKLIRILDHAVTKIIFAAIGAALFTYAFYVFMSIGLEGRTAFGILQIAMDFLAAIVCLMFYVGCSADANLKGRKNTIFRALFFIIGFFAVIEALADVYNTHAEYRLLTAFYSAIAYLAYPTLLTVGWHYVEAAVGKKNRVLTVITYVLLAISLLAAVSNFFYPLYFYVDLNGEYYDSSYVWIFLLIVCAQLLMDIIYVLAAKGMKPTDKFMLIVLLIAPAALNFVSNPALTYFVITLIMVITYCIMSVRRGVEIEELETEITKQKLDIMISQIQPHFIFNALNTICFLCRKDPDLAEKAVRNFSGYLRANIDSLDNKELIPFEKEMEHVKTYVELEALRFIGKFQIEYATEDVDFKVPYLTIQPIVENSIKHGMPSVQGKVLHIRICSVLDGKKHVITVEDDGVGFNPKKAEETNTTNKRHIGIQNVASRIESMCGGTFEMLSQPGQGTRTIITIPKQN